MKKKKKKSDKILYYRNAYEATAAVVDKHSNLHHDFWKRGVREPIVVVGLALFQHTDAHAFGSNCGLS